MAEPRLVAERKSVNLSLKSGISNSAKKPSQRAVDQFNAQSSLINNKTKIKARDALANQLSATSINDGNYPKCTSTSGTPCIDTGGYEDKRAYAGSGMAGWKEAGLAGNYVNNTNTEERIEFAKVYLPRVGMGITAMVATMYAPQAVPYIAKSAGASYMSMNATSYTTTGLLADEVILYSAGGVAAYFTPASPPANPIEALGLGASIATDLLK